MSRSVATWVGFGAIALWSLLALLTVGTAPTPPFLLNAICFSIGGTLGLVWIAKAGSLARLREVPLSVYVFGTAGLFGYHALYFSALRLAPPAEAGLIAYLWPLLIVLFSGLLPGERLRKGHVLGALAGFIGATLLIGQGLSANVAALPGYILALGCALTWSGYSVLSRKLGDIPTETVAVFCIASAILSALLHPFVETTAWPDGFLGWMSAIGLGIGPVGLAFYVWDVGVKKGDIQLLGTASYAAPLLSTVILVLAGVAAPQWSLAFAACLITGGAVLAARASLKST